MLAPPIPTSMPPMVPVPASRHCDIRATAPVAQLREIGTVADFMHSRGAAARRE
jgi:hypothetical protein